VVDVLEGNVSTTYTYTELEQKIATLPQNVRFSFTDTDIAWAAAHPDLGAHFEFHMTTQWSALHDTDITEHMDGIPFRLSCNGQSLFVGVFYLLWGQAALDTPVLHPDRDTNNSVILRLGAWEGAWASYAAVGHLETVSASIAPSFVRSCANGARYECWTPLPCPRVTSASIALPAGNGTLANRI
jgi:hypothetical protein